MKTIIATAVLCMTASVSHAGFLAILGDGVFDVAITEDGSTPVQDTGILFAPTDTDCDLLGPGACDYTTTLVSGNEYSVDFSASNVFTVGFGAPAPEAPIIFSLTGLDFEEGKLLDIVSVDFNEAGPHSGFLFDPEENPFGIMTFDSPGISFTANSIEVTLFTTAEFGGDGPRFEFTVGFAETDVPAVPLPATGLSLLAGFGIFGAMRRLKKS